MGCFLSCIYQWGTLSHSQTSTHIKWALSPVVSKASISLRSILLLCWPVHHLSLRASWVLPATGLISVYPLCSCQKDCSKVGHNGEDFSSPLHKSFPCLSTAYRCKCKLGYNAPWTLLGLAFCPSIQLHLWPSLFLPQSASFSMSSDPIGYFSFDSHLHKILALPLLSWWNPTCPLRVSPISIVSTKPLPTVWEKLRGSFLKATSVCGTERQDSYRPSCVLFVCI